MISFFPDGTVKGAKNYCSYEKCIVGDFDLCKQSYGRVFKTDCSTVITDGDEVDEDVEDDIDEDEVDDNYEITKNIYADIITPGTLVALNSFTHLEQFYICKVIECSTAENDIEDDNLHIVSKGEIFFKFHYLAHQRKRCPLLQGTSQHSVYHTKLHNCYILQ